MRAHFVLSTIFFLYVCMYMDGAWFRAQTAFIQRKTGETTRKKEMSDSPYFTPLCGRPELSDVVKFLDSRHVAAAYFHNNRKKNHVLVIFVSFRNPMRTDFDVFTDVNNFFY